MSSFQESQMSREELLEQITKMIEQMPLDKLYECAGLLGIEEDEYFKEHGCNMCRGYFDAGKDNCKKCGLDLNCFNKDELSDEEDDLDKYVCSKCDNPKKQYDILDPEGKWQLKIAGKEQFCSCK